MSQKSRFENKKNAAIARITTVNRPVQTSLIIGGFWILLIIMLSVLLMLANKRNYLYNINIASFVGIAISIIW